MPKFRVRGLDARGVERAYVVEAPDQAAASAAAKARGIFPTSTAPAEAAGPLPVVESIGGESDFEYWMIGLSPNIVARPGMTPADQAAAYLSRIVGQHAVDGWRFHRVDSFGVSVPPGCIGAFFGRQAVEHQVRVATFVRPSRP